MAYNVKPGLTVMLLTQEEANRHTRRTHSIPDDCGLGWTPYTIIVQDGTLAYCAFNRMADFKRWLGWHKLQLSTNWRRQSFRMGRIV